MLPIPIKGKNPHPGPTFEAFAEKTPVKEFCQNNFTQNI